MSNPFDPLDPWLQPKKEPQPPIDWSSLIVPPKTPPALSFLDLLGVLPTTQPVGALSGIVTKPVKPKVFVSYHHKNDQEWYNEFSKLFADSYELFTDTSIGRKIDSEDPIYQSRKIREDHISGSSITVVLIGSETWKRKHVDWEIHATLEKKHALLGIVLPNHSKNVLGNIIVPDRLLDNVNSGFAYWIHWSRDASLVSSALTTARQLAKSSTLIRNSMPQLSRNRS